MKDFLMTYTMYVYLIIRIIPKYKCKCMFKLFKKYKHTGSFTLIVPKD